MAQSRTQPESETPICFWSPTESGDLRQGGHEEPHSTDLLFEHRVGLRLLGEGLEALGGLLARQAHSDSDRSRFAHLRSHIDISDALDRVYRMTPPAGPRVGGYLSG